MSRLRQIQCAKTCLYIPVVDKNDELIGYAVFRKDSYDYRGFFIGRPKVTDRTNVRLTRGLKRAIIGAGYTIQGHSVKRT